MAEQHSPECATPDDVLVVGEALVDIVVADGRAPVEHPGGSPANVALGLGRLGRRVSLLTRIGDDERGRAIAAHLRDSGVRLLEASLTSGSTSTAVARLDEAGVATYDFAIDWRLPQGSVPEGTPRAKALHTGSIAAFIAPGADAVLDLVTAARERMTLSYDPNARPRLMGEAGAARERVERFVAASDVVKVSDEDLAWLCPGEDIDGVARAWLGTGPAVVVVTRGGDGAVAHCGAGRVEIPGRQIAVEDTVGAGDSFSSGLLDHLAATDLLGADRLADLRAIGTDQVGQMLEHATMISAITCGRPGADPPWRSDLEDG